MSPDTTTAHATDGEGTNAEPTTQVPAQSMIGDAGTSPEPPDDSPATDAEADATKVAAYLAQS